MPRHASAAVEAEEEAGVIGAVCPTPIGSYQYRKRRANGASVMLDVEVFPLAVTRELAVWKEQDERERRWIRFSDAVVAVDGADLQALIRPFGASSFRSVARPTCVVDHIAAQTGVNQMLP